LELKLYKSQETMDLSLSLNTRPSNPKSSSALSNKWEKVEQRIGEIRIFFPMLCKNNSKRNASPLSTKPSRSVLLARQYARSLN
jgi:hypothetical protein